MPDEQRPARRRLPWWTWIAPVALLVAADAVMDAGPLLRSPAAAGLDPAMAVGVALVHWWGPRVIPGALLASTVSGVLAGQPWWVGLLQSPPLLLAVAASWWLFGRFGRGGPARRRPWIGSLPDMARLLGWGLIVPVATAEALRAGLFLVTAGPVMDVPLQFTAYALGDMLSCFALTVPALMFATAGLERRGWTVTRGASATRVLGGERTGPREAALLAAVLVAMMLFCRHVPIDGAWVAFGLAVVLAGSRWGAGAAAVVTGWAVVVPLFHPEILQQGEAWRRGGTAFALALVRAEGALATFGLCGLLLGRTLGDARREVASRRRSEEAARASEARLADAQRAAGVGCWEWEARTGRTWWSDELYRIAGRAPGEILPGYEAFLSLLAPEDRARTRRRIAASVTTGVPYEIEHRIRRPDGTLRTVWTRGAVERDEGGRARRIVGTSQDVTDLREREAERDRLEAALVEARRLESLGVLAGGLAHDFNNLLVGIRANADLVDGDARLSPEGRAALARVVGAAERAGGLVRRLLQTAGRGAMSTGPVDVPTLVHGVVELVQPTLRPGVAVLEDHAPDLPTLEADGGQFEQVVLNLLINAAEAIAPATGGTVRVATRVVHLDAATAARNHPAEPVAVGGYVALEVTDDGCGMDADTLARIFEPFFTTRFDGRGLGLAAVRGIVRRHRGAIEVESRVGAGTTMRALFPLRAARAASAPPGGADSVPAAGAGAAEAHPAVGPASADRPTVLLVDDVEAVLTAAEQGLRLAGWQVIAVDSGARARAVLRRPPRPIDLVVLDWTMPGVSGAEVLADLRSRDADLPVLVVSGDAEARAAEAAARDPATTFLHKPFGLEALQQACREAVAGGDRAVSAG